MAEQVGHETSRLYFGGIPTEPDVKKLMEHFGTPSPGVIPHAKIAEVVGLKYESSRYWTVVRAWERHLFYEHNIEVVAEPGKGRRVLTEAERVDHGVKQVRSVTRKAVRTHNHAATINRDVLDDAQRRKYDHLMTAGRAIAEPAIAAQRRLTSALRAPRQLPSAGPMET